MSSSARDPEIQRRDRPVLESPRTTREQQTGESADAEVHGFSIVLGGPVYDFLLRIGMVRTGFPNIVRRVVLFVGIACLPLLLLSLKDGLALGHKVQVPLLYDFSMYGRFLLGLPLLLLAEITIDPAIRRAVHQFVSSGLVHDEDLPAFRRVLHDTQRLRDAAIPELVLLALAFFPVFLFQYEWTRITVSSWHTTSQGLTAPGWWYAAVSTPLLRFLVYRWAFRYFIWSVLLLRLGRLNLHLMPTHPDHAAGLEFLSLTQRRFGILFCALGCAFAGRVANGMMFEGTPVASFKYLMAGFMVLSLIVGLLPLMLLAPKLAKVRRVGLIEYGKLANDYTQSFDRKWVHPVAHPSEPLLGTGDIQSLADLGNSFGIIHDMAIAPITRRLTLQLAVQAGAPLLVVIIAGTPTTELVSAILKMVM